MHMDGAGGRALPHHGVRLATDRSGAAELSIANDRATVGGRVSGRVQIDGAGGGATPKNGVDEVAVVRPGFTHLVCAIGREGVRVLEAGRMRVDDLRAIISRAARMNAS